MTSQRDHMRDEGALDPDAEAHDGRRGRGRPPALTPEQVEAVREYNPAVWNATEVATLFGVHASTIRNVWARRGA